MKLTDKVKKGPFLPNPSFVLRALKIMGLEEVERLSEVLKVKQMSLKKAAGEELIVWDDVPEERPAQPAKKKDEGKVLNFPKKKITDLAPLPEEGESSEEDSSGLMSTEVILWQREISRQNGKGTQKAEAFKGYRKSTEMYVVKNSDKEGSDKIRFASTNGVLVNKKQA